MGDWRGGDWPTWVKDDRKRSWPRKLRWKVLEMMNEMRYKLRNTLLYSGVLFHVSRYHRLKTKYGFTSWITYWKPIPNSDPLSNYYTPHHCGTEISGKLHIKLPLPLCEIYGQISYLPRVLLLLLFFLYIYIYIMAIWKKNVLDMSSCVFWTVFTK